MGDAHIHWQASSPRRAGVRRLGLAVRIPCAAAWRDGAVALLLGVALLLVACAPGLNPQVDSASAEGIVAGFWRGLWHGIIAPVTFVISLFTPTVQMYEVHNNGGWYNFGFFLGMTTFHGAGHAARRPRRARVDAVR